MSDVRFMQLALRLARRGYGQTSPNPMVGAVLVKSGRILGRGWHRRAGEPHAEIEALRDAQEGGHGTRGATLYVTLEPCSTQGRTPPCTDAIIAAGLRRVVIGAVDPNPRHSGRAFKMLRRAGIEVEGFGVPRLRGKNRTARPGRPTAKLRAISDECARLNEAFNHWIVRRTPFVTVKAAMTLDGKIATAGGESKWITSEQARAFGMRMRQGADVILVGINTILADDPSLTLRGLRSEARGRKESKRLRRIVLDSMARTPLKAKVVSDRFAGLTTIVVTDCAPGRRVAALSKRVNVLVAPTASPSPLAPRASAFAPRASPRIDLRWLLKQLGGQSVTSLLVEGGGETNASFLRQGLAHRVAFFYAPRILGGRDSRRAVAGGGAVSWNEVLHLEDLKWRRLGPDLVLTARAK